MSSMRVSQWTSSYNAQFRDQNAVIAPNAGEPMHHFPGHYDPSHYQRDPGFYGTRAKLAATAKFEATQSGMNVRVPVPGSNVGFGSAPTKSRTSGLNQSFYAPPPDPNTQHYSALRQTGLNALQTQRVGGGEMSSTGGYNGSSSFRGTNTGGSAAPGGAGFSGGSNTGRVGPSHGAPAGGASSALPAGDSLWTASLVPHGDKSSYSAARGPTLASPSQSTGGFSATQGGGLIDSAFVDSPSDWRYDARGAAMTKEVELRRNTDPRNKYMIPGYSGFVRGKQFLHGDTFGKVTRNCLDIPLDQPTDLD